MAEKKTPSIVDEGFFISLREDMQNDSFRLKVREVIRTMIKSMTLYVHREVPCIVIERTNGNFWTIQFYSTKEKNRQFQLYKGIASDEDEMYQCEEVYRGSGKF